jgi:hypothetical protein
MGILDKLKESAIERKKESSIRRMQKAEAREVYLEEKGKQEIEFARARAKAESHQRITAMQQSFKKPKGSGNIMGGLSGAANGVLNFATGGFGGMGLQPPPQQKPKVVYRRKGKRGKRTRVVRQKAQPQMQGYNWF